MTLNDVKEEEVVLTSHNAHVRTAEDEMGMITSEVVVEQVLSKETSLREMQTRSM